MISTGIGWDVHRLAPGRPLILGGVTIDSELGLDGHSDADVLTHAIIDALLGAIGAGDIGEHFPDTDEQWRGADSLELLRHVDALLGERGCHVVNIDATVILERPKIGAHKQAMRERIADVLDLAPARVNVKATRGEGMGFIGRVEGAAALAIATVSTPAVAGYE